jgi:hypothetical protein
MVNSTFFRISILFASCLLLFAGTALALPVAGQYVKFDTSAGLGNADGGGEFYLDIGTSSTAGFDNQVDYISFCLEIHENINASTFDSSPAYYIESVSDQVTGGGTDNGDLISGYDVLSDATQWVYYQYSQTDYFGTHDNATANAIQNMIWFFEDEITTMSVGANDLYNSKVSGQVTNAFNDYVTAINLRYYGPDGTTAQSQLISTPVPEPGVTLLFGIGVLGFAGVTRRRSTK